MAESVTKRAGSAADDANIKDGDFSKLITDPAHKEDVLFIFCENFAEWNKWCPRDKTGRFKPRGSASIKKSIGLIGPPKVDDDLSKISIYAFHAIGIPTAWDAYTDGWVYAEDNGTLTNPR
jgi:hypothetical protein